jgi:hypothetical protein
LNVFVLLARLSKSMGDSANSLFNGAGWLLLLLEDAVQRDDLSARYPSNAPRYPRQVRWRGAVPVGGGEITRRSHSLDCADDHRWSERTRGCEETNLADVKTRMHGPIHYKHPPGLCRQVCPGSLLKKCASFRDGRFIAGYKEDPIRASCENCRSRRGYLHARAPSPVPHRAAPA